MQAWIDTVERLAEATGRWRRGLRRSTRRSSTTSSTATCSRALRLRVGELARTKLGDKALAIAEYKKALDARGDDRRAHDRARGAVRRGRRLPELLAILKLRVENAESDDEKKKLLFREAELQKGPLADPSGAIATYEAILDVALEPDGHRRARGALPRGGALPPTSSPSTSASSTARSASPPTSG